MFRQSYQLNLLFNNNVIYSSIKNNKTVLIMLNINVGCCLLCEFLFFNLVQKIKLACLINPSVHIGD